MHGGTTSKVMQEVGGGLGPEAGSLWAAAVPWVLSCCFQTLQAWMKAAAEGPPLRRCSAVQFAGCS